MTDEQIADLAKQLNALPYQEAARIILNLSVTLVSRQAYGMKPTGDAICRLDGPDACVVVATGFCSGILSRSHQLIKTHLQANHPNGRSARIDLSGENKP